MKLHSTRRAAAALTMATVLAGGLSTAVAGSAHADNVHNFPAKVDLNGRKHIGEAADAPGHIENQYRAGQNVPVTCQQDDGGALWDKTADNTWVPDKYVKTGTDGRAAGVPDCGEGQHPSGGEYTIKPVTSAYTWWDNDWSDGRGDATSYGDHHAAGNGSFQDPVTIAVGKRGGVLDFPVGTKMYIPSLKKYVVVEDLCGQCSKEAKNAKIDLWIDGRESSSSAANSCAESLTKSREVIVNAAPGKAVNTGRLFENGKCVE